MTPEPKTDMLAEALNAYDNGLCVVRAMTDGTKRPMGQWKQYQSERPTRAEVEAWFSTGHAGLGVITGAVSGDLEMFELEAKFVHTHGTADFVKRMNEAGLELLLKRLVNGLLIVSPSDGRHFIYRNAGALDGNTKLARNASHETLIETRGEGGFVVLPPSHGTVHPSGKPWKRHAGNFDSIPTITAEEREALFAVARSYDEAPAPIPVKPASAARRASMVSASGVVGSSWFEAVEQHLNATWRMRDLLEHYGWEFGYVDKHDRTLMRRPGKDDGVSGSINANGRLLPFSSSVPFEVGGKPPSTYDLLDVIAAYEHSGDRQAAARAVADSTGIMAAWRRERDEEARAAFGITVPAPPTTPALPANVDPETGEIISAEVAGGLDEEFWTARPTLAHIRTAARARMVGPAAVLGAIMARVAAFTPPSTCLPATVGSTAPLSLYVALSGRSGAGKSSPVAAASDLLPITPPGCVGPLSLGSGEGLVEAYMELVEEEDGGGKKRKVKRQIYHGALFNLDEGQLALEISSRRGSTLLPVLRTAWSGSDPGQANASIETRRSLRSGSYALGLISLWQDKAATNLLADSDGGTPQRFVWMTTTDIHATVDTPPWPGPLRWEPPAAISFDGFMQPAPLDVDGAIIDEIKRGRVAELRGEVEVDPLDAHRRLNKLKIAGVLGVLDGRHSITVEDWELAERILMVSDQIRDWVLHSARLKEADRLVAEAKRSVAREAIVERSAADRALERAAKAVHRAAQKAGGQPVSLRQIHHCIASRDRQLVSVTDAVAEAERLSWVTPAGDGVWSVGLAKPA